MQLWIDHIQIKSEVPTEPIFRAKPVTFLGAPTPSDINRAGKPYRAAGHGG